jgi:hypothetical protein
MTYAKSDKEVENVKRLWTDKGQTAGNQKSSPELSAQVS